MPAGTATQPAHPLNLADRLFLMLDGIGAPAQIFMGVELDGRLAPAVLQRAANALIGDYPKLNTRAERRLLGYRRVPADGSGLDDLVILSRTESEVLQKRLNLRGSRGIQWSCINRDDGRSLLLMTIHHSVCDGTSALVALERFSVHYAYFTGKKSMPDAVAGDMPHRYRDYFRRMPAREQLSIMVRACIRTIRLAAGFAVSEACATFTDMPLPCTGELRKRIIAIPTSDVHCLMRWAVRRRATVADALLAAAVVSGVSTWPQNEENPVAINLPLGGTSDAGLANRMMSSWVRIPLNRCKSFPGVLQTVAEQTAPARRSAAGIRETLVENAALSFLPPIVFDRMARSYFAQRTNTRETMTLSVLGGPLDPPMMEFGNLKVLDVFTAGSVLAPPGLRLGIVAAPGKLNLCISYLYPVISETSMDRFVDGIRSALAETGIGRAAAEAFV